MRVEFQVSKGSGTTSKYIQEYTNEELEGMTQEEIEDMIEEDFNTWVWENIDAGWEIIEE